MKAKGKFRIGAALTKGLHVDIKKKIKRNTIRHYRTGIYRINIIQKNWNFLKRIIKIKWTQNRRWNLDDIIVFGKNLEDHDDKIIDVFERLKINNLKIEPS